MCVICIKKKGIKMPNNEELLRMWKKNPHGAGYMYARNNNVYIRKGFMNFNEFLAAINKEKFTDDDVIVLHFRISTQAGITKEMTQPFPLSKDLDKFKKLRIKTNYGIAHNGIIRLTSDYNEKTYSDTALFISKYLINLIRKEDDFYNPNIKTMISELSNSKLVLLNKKGDLLMIGTFKEYNGLYYSNLNHRLYF